MWIFWWWGEGCSTAWWVIQWWLRNMTTWGDLTRIWEEAGLVSSEVPFWRNKNFLSLQESEERVKKNSKYHSQSGQSFSYPRFKPTKNQPSKPKNKQQKNIVIDCPHPPPPPPKKFTLHVSRTADINGLKSWTQTAQCTVFLLLEVNFNPPS